MKSENLNNDMIPVGTTVHINPKDIKWECNGGDLISRSELKKVLDPYRFAICGFEGVLALIDNAPAVEYTFEEAFQKTVCEQRLYCPERPQGKWIDTGDKNEYWAEEYQCSICGAKDHWHNFCPNCGAKMKGGGTV
jgi:predicted RNA-binding Zn-ribbon protein involved in translation (DUF1610 family)